MIVEFRITKGASTLIDAEDALLVFTHSWHLTSRGYAATRIPGYQGKKSTIALLHRFLLGAVPGQNVDHVNGDKLDNRRCNIRLATPTQNSANTKSHRNSSSRFKGVHWSKQRGCWQSQIMTSGTVRYLGCYVSEEVAAQAYDTAAKELQGEFAKLNFPETGHEESIHHE